MWARFSYQYNSRKKREERLWRDRRVTILESCDLTRRGVWALPNLTRRTTSTLTAIMPRSRMFSHPYD